MFTAFCASSFSRHVNNGIQATTWSRRFVVPLSRRLGFDLGVWSYWMCDEQTATTIGFDHRTSDSPSYSFIHLFIHAFIYLFIHSFLNSCIHSCIHLFIHSCIHLFIHSYIYSFMHLLIHWYIHSFIHSFIYSFIYSFIHSFYYHENCLILTNVSQQYSTVQYLYLNKWDTSMV
jgi:hypothetical protein